MIDNKKLLGNDNDIFQIKEVLEKSLDNKWTQEFVYLLRKFFYIEYWSNVEKNERYTIQMIQEILKKHLDFLDEDRRTEEVLRKFRAMLPYLQQLVISDMKAAYEGGEIVLLVFAYEMKVGIDVQKINEYLEYKEMANNFFSPVEAQDVNCGNIKLFFQYWSAKEAYLKALGIGLGNGMDFFSVKGNVIEENGIIKHEWKLIPITIKNYAAYVAVHTT